MRRRRMRSADKRRDNGRQLRDFYLAEFLDGVLAAAVRGDVKLAVHQTSLVRNRADLAQWQFHLRDPVKPALIQKKNSLVRDRDQPGITLIDTGGHSANRLAPVQDRGQVADLLLCKPL